MWLGANTYTAVPVRASRFLATGQVEVALSRKFFDAAAGGVHIHPGCEGTW